MKGGKSSIRENYGQDDEGGDEGEKTAYTWTAGAATAKGNSAAAMMDGGKAAAMAAVAMMAKGMDPWSKGKGKGPWAAGGGANPWGAGAAASGWMDPWSMMKGAGKWKGPMTFKELEPWKQEANNYPGLLDSMKECVAPIASLEDKLTADELMMKLTTYFTKTATTYAKDERLGQKGSSVQAQALVEEFVETALGAIWQGCHEKAWLPEAGFSAPLCLLAEQLFKTSKLFSRMLAPMLHKYVEDAVFRFKEEERMKKLIWETIETSGLPESYYKKCNNHLLKAYDDAHISAAYGASMGETPELGLLQDFVRGWMSEFVGRAWDVLENGVGSREEQVVFVTNLFQILAHPERLCLPHDLVASLESPPPANWPYIAQTAIEIFLDMDKPSNKQLKKSQGWGQRPQW